MRKKSVIHHSHLISPAQKVPAADRRNVPGAIVAPHVGSPARAHGAQPRGDGVRPGGEVCVGGEAGHLGVHRHVRGQRGARLRVCVEEGLLGVAHAVTIPLVKIELCPGCGR